MKITSKIVLGYLVLILFAVAVGLLGYREIGRVGVEFDRAVNQTQPVADALREIDDLGKQIQILCGRLVMAQGDSGQVRSHVALQLDTVLQKIEAVRLRHRDLILRYFPDELQMADQIHSRLVEIADKSRSLAGNDGNDPKAPLLAGYLAVDVAVGELHESLTEAIEEEMAEFREYQNSIGAIVWQHKVIILSGALVALLLGAVGGILMTRQITGPLIRLRNGVTQFGQGDLKVRLTPEANDEIGDLAGTFNAMAETLRGTVVSRDYVNNILESMSEGLIVLTPDFRIRMANKAAYHLLGRRESDEIIGARVETLFSGVDELLEPFVESRGRTSVEISLINAAGAPNTLSITISPLFDHDRVAGSMLLIQDITTRKESEEKLRYMANYDALTGLANRNMLTLCLNQSVSRLPWSGRYAAVFCCDLDRFKFINDSLGHSVGDELLQRIAGRLKSLVRPGDMVFRLGGDEFVILLTEVAERGDIQSVAEKVVRGITEPVNVGLHELLVTTSIGISVAPTDGSDAEELLKNADLAMYEAKRIGKNQYCFYAEQMGKRTQERMRLETALHRAITVSQELVVFYQPQLTIDGVLIGFEALVRWQHPTLGFISPADFLPAAEEAGWMGILDEWVLRRACQDLARWHAAGETGLRVAVNISDQMFKRVDLLQVVGEALRDHGLSPASLELELTEAVVMRDVDQGIRVMDALRNLGVPLSIDDFGTGYSSFGQLKRCPIQTLKIDRSFVSDIVTDPNDTEIVEAIIVMAKRLGINTLAEGVENEEQMAILRSSGCQMVQGYHFGRPVPFAEVQAGLARFPRPAAPGAD